MNIRREELTHLNDQLNRDMECILKCTGGSERFGRLLLASPPDMRYPYVYPRDTSSALAFFRRALMVRAGDWWKLDSG